MLADQQSRSTEGHLRWNVEIDSESVTHRNFFISQQTSISGKWVCKDLDWSATSVVVAGNMTSLQCLHPSIVFKSLALHQPKETESRAVSKSSNCSRFCAGLLGLIDRDRDDESLENLLASWNPVCFSENWVQYSQVSRGPKQSQHVHKTMQKAERKWSERTWRLEKKTNWKIKTRKGFLT